MKQTIDWINIWNKWIDFCKKSIAYDLARAFMFSLIAYSIVGLGGHYIIGYEAIDAHYAGIIFSIYIFTLLFLSFGKKNRWLKDLFKDMDKEVEE